MANKLGTDSTTSISHPCSIFRQHWWLDAVSPGQWDEVIIEKKGDIIATLPYFIEKRYGFRFFTLPPLTPVLGPWFRPSDGKYTNQLSHQHKMMTDLILQLPEFDLFRQNFHHSITNWLPFHWQGFQQTTRYTYVIENLLEPDRVWQSFRENIRRNIRKAQKTVQIRHDLDLNRFIDIHEMTFKQQGLSLPYDRAVIHRIDEACTERQCCKTFFAEDVQGKLHGAVYLVWDNEAAYYLMGGADNTLRQSGAVNLLLWEAIQFAGTVTRTFNFDGSMIDTIERFFRAFGGVQKPYFQVSKIKSVPLKVFMDMRDWSRMEKN